MVIINHIVENILHFYWFEDSYDINIDNKMFPTLVHEMQVICQSYIK